VLTKANAMVFNLEHWALISWLVPMQCRLATNDIIVKLCWPM